MIRFHKPLLEELRFRQQLLSDEQTMAYNDRWGGAVGFPQDRWADWYSRWVEHPDRRFYAYLYSEEEKAFVGEAAYHFDEELDGCIVDVIVHSRYRGRGYGTQGLQLLCEQGRRDGLEALYDDIADDNPSLFLFLKNGFERVRDTEEGILVKKVL